MTKIIPYVFIACCFSAPLFAMADEIPDKSRFLYIKDLETTMSGEKAGNFCGPLDEIVFDFRERTGKEWWRGNSSFSLMFGNKGVTQPSPNKIGMFPFKKTDPKSPNFYKITIDNGVLIQGNTESGLTDAAEHLLELLEGEGDDLRLPKGVYTAKERKPGHSNYFPIDPEGGRNLDALWSLPNRDSQSETEILKVVRKGFLTCQTPKDQILRWIGEKFIGHNPQSRSALNLMIEAAILPDEAIRRDAIQYGLNRASWKTLRMHRAMLAAAMKANDNGETVKSIAFGFRYSERDYQDFVELLAPYQKSGDKSVRDKAIFIRQTLDKSLSDLKKTDNENNAKVRKIK